VDAETFDGIEGLPLADAAVSTLAESTNGVPIVVERAMWWPGAAPGAWTEGHHSPGATGGGTLWAMADGEVGVQPADADTYVLVANVSAREGQARVTLLFEGGGETSATMAAPAGRRTTIDVRRAFPEAVGRRFGILVESLGASPASLVVERATYWNADGVAWSAGTGALADRLR
jgi:hypothetical protein